MKWINTLMDKIAQSAPKDYKKGFKDGFKAGLKFHHDSTNRLYDAVMQPHIIEREWSKNVK